MFLWKCDFFHEHEKGKQLWHWSSKREKDRISNCQNSTWMHQTHKPSTNLLYFQNQTPSILQAMLWKESDVITQYGSQISIILFPHRLPSNFKYIPWAMINFFTNIRIIVSLIPQTISLLWNFMGESSLYEDNLCLKLE